jgi:hypothetical protein
MTERDLDRLAVLRQLHEGVLAVAGGARRLRLSTRHMRRLLRRFKKEREECVAHGLRGWPSNRRLDEALRRRALGKSREANYEDFGPTVLSEHLEREDRNAAVHPSTDGRWTPKKRRSQHRRRRDRRGLFGELVLMETSIHA